jgi:hypothetical protein
MSKFGLDVLWFGFNIKIREYRMFRCMVRTIIINIILITLIIIGSCQITSSFHIPQSSLAPKIIDSEVNAIDSPTNVSVTKSIRGVGDSLECKYRIKTPAVDSINFVLAIASSSTLGPGEKKIMQNAIFGAITGFLNETIIRYPDKSMNISILSFSNNIDFAYWNFRNINPKKAKVVPIQMAIKDIINNKEFHNNFYSIQRNDPINLSLAIDASTDVLDNIPPNERKKERRFIILVVGDSAFYSCDENILKKALNNGYSVYSIGMGLHENSHLLQELIEISTMPRLLRTSATATEPLEKNLLNALEDALKLSVSTPVAADLVISDSFDYYLKPDYSMIEIIGQNGPYKIDKIEYIKQSDGTNSICFEIPYGLYSNTITEVTLRLDIAIAEVPGLIEKTYNGKEIRPHRRNSPTSAVSYTWFNGRKSIISLPKKQLNSNSISISSRARTLWRLIFS